MLYEKAEIISAGKEWATNGHVRLAVEIMHGIQELVIHVRSFLKFGLDHF